MEFVGCGLTASIYGSDRLDFIELISDGMFPSPSSLPPLELGQRWQS